MSRERTSRLIESASHGPPIEIVIYLDDGGWRHSIRTKKGGLLCGRLPSVTATDSDEVARNEARGLVLGIGVEYFGIGLEVEWAPADEAGWRTGR